MASDAQRELVRWFFAEESRMGSGVTDDKFRSLDANGDGFLTRDELLPALGATLRAWGNYGTTGLRITEAVIAMADTEHDGKVSLAEFLALGKVLQEVATLKAEAERHRRVLPKSTLVRKDRLGSARRATCKYIASTREPCSLTFLGRRRLLSKLKRLVVNGGRSMSSFTVPEPKLDALDDVDARDAHYQCTVCKAPSTGGEMMYTCKACNAASFGGFYLCSGCCAPKMQQAAPAPKQKQAAPKKKKKVAKRVAQEQQAAWVRRELGRDKARRERQAREAELT